MKNLDLSTAGEAGNTWECFQSRLVGSLCGTLELCGQGLRRLVSIGFRKAAVLSFGCVDTHGPVARAPDDTSGLGWLRGARMWYLLKTKDSCSAIVGGSMSIPGLYSWELGNLVEVFPWCSRKGYDAKRV